MPRPLPPSRAIMREYRCTFCGAKPGQPCTSWSGAPHVAEHGARFDQAFIEGRLPIKEDA